jgi:hypothetical protein
MISATFVSRALASQDYFARVITFGNDADQPLLLHHQQSADILRVHHFDGFENRCIRRNREDLAAFLIQDRADGATHVHKRSFRIDPHWLGMQSNSGGALRIGILAFPTPEGEYWKGALGLAI